MDLSAAAAVCSAPKPSSSERLLLKAEAKLNLWRSDTSRHSDCLFRVTLCLLCFSPQRQQALRSLFLAPVSVFKRKLRQGCCVRYHRRETRALIQHAALPGSKRTQNVSNQSLQRVLREFFFIFFYSGDAITPHL